MNKKSIDIVTSCDPLVRRSSATSASASRAATSTVRSASPTQKRPSVATPTTRTTSQASRPTSQASRPASQASRATSQTQTRPQASRPAQTSARVISRSVFAPKAPSLKPNVLVKKSPSKAGIVEHLGEIPREKQPPITPEFINLDDIEKRPLGASSRAAELISGPDTQFDARRDPRRARHDPVRKPKTKQKFSIHLPLIILITIVLGIVSGVGVYLLLSKK